MATSTLMAFDSVAVRIEVDDSGAPWFRAGDVCAALGLDDVSQAVGRLRDAEKAKKIQPRVSQGVAPAPEVWFVSEAGVYRLILRSNKPEAERFQDWITGEVLPSIRKTGAYSVAPAAPLSIEEMTIKVITSMQEKIAALEPKARALDELANIEGLHGLQDAAKLIGARPQKWIDGLKASRDLHYRGSHLVPAQEHIDSGRMTLKVRIVDGKEYAQTYVTAAGLAYFGDRFWRETLAHRPFRLAQ